MLGQINRNSVLGETLYELVKQSDINTIVEIGTWNGAGSTRCIVDGIKDSGKKKTFLTLESNRQQYELALQNTREFCDFVTLIYGRIIDPYDLTWLKNITLGPEQQQWLWEDIDSYKSCPNVLDKIPEKIDLLFLDGGEFSTIPEFIKLKTRYTYLVLDDINELKCKEINKQLKARKDHELVKTHSERNGFSVFIRH
jgi:hypothetical protein